MTIFTRKLVLPLETKVVGEEVIKSLEDNLITANILSEFDKHAPDGWEAKLIMLCRIEDPIYLSLEFDNLRGELNKEFKIILENTKPPYKIVEYSINPSDPGCFVKFKKILEDAQKKYVT